MKAKKFLAFLLAGLMLLSFVGCGETPAESEQDSAVNDNGTDTQAPPDTSTPPQTTTTTELQSQTTTEPPNEDTTTEPTMSVEVGEIITFGNYDWRVLDVQEGRALILTDRIIANREIHYRSQAITWAESNIREWLNGEFLNSFSASDRERIAYTSVVNNDNPWFDTPGGADTTDYIFLLSIEEVVQYFGDSGQLANRPLDAVFGNFESNSIEDQFYSDRIAVLNESFTLSATDSVTGVTHWGDTISAGEPWGWTLRSPGGRSPDVASVSSVSRFIDGNIVTTPPGHICIRGGDVSGHNHGIRPALWLYL